MHAEGSLSVIAMSVDDHSFKFLLLSEIKAKLIINKKKLVNRTKIRLRPRKPLACVILSPELEQTRVMPVYLALAGWA